MSGTVKDKEAKGSPFLVQLNTRVNVQKMTELPVSPSLLHKLFSLATSMLLVNVKKLNTSLVQTKAVDPSHLLVRDKVPKAAPLLVLYNTSLLLDLVEEANTSLVPVKR